MARDWASWPLRALLFTPANDPRKLRRVANFGADAIVLDLEDAVADSEKDAARLATRAALPTFDDRQAVLVRINAPGTGRAEADVRAVACARLDGIVVPKVESLEQLVAIGAMLDEAERMAGVQAGTTALFALIETARGLLELEDWRRGPLPERLVTVMFGSVDFALDIGVERSPSGEELAHARSRVVVAAAAAGLGAPIDGPWTALRDEPGLIADTRRSRSLGFQGRVVVYPPHVGPVHSAYSDLSEDEEAQARRVVAAFEAANREGRSSIQVDGRFVDYPVYYRALAQLQRFERLRSDPG